MWFINCTSKLWPLCLHNKLVQPNREPEKNCRLDCVQTDQWPNIANTRVWNYPGQTFWCSFWNKNCKELRSFIFQVLYLFTGVLMNFKFINIRDFYVNFVTGTDFSLFLLENPRLQCRFLISPQELNHYNERSQISQTWFSKNWQEHDRLKFSLVKKIMDHNLVIIFIFSWIIHCIFYWATEDHFWSSKYNM